MKAYQAHNANPLLRELTETTGTYNGINYAIMTQTYNKVEVEQIHYECNCSVFHTVAEVEAFITLVF